MEFLESEKEIAVQISRFLRKYMEREFSLRYMKLKLKEQSTLPKLKLSGYPILNWASISIFTYPRVIVILAMFLCVTGFNIKGVK